MASAAERAAAQTAWEALQAQPEHHAAHLGDALVKAGLVSPGLLAQMLALPDGPEREALMREAKNMLVAHMPYKVHVHTITNDLLQPRVRGFWRHPFARESWIYTGVDKETST